MVAFGWAALILTWCFGVAWCFGAGWATCLAAAWWCAGLWTTLTCFRWPRPPVGAAAAGGVTGVTETGAGVVVPVGGVEVGVGDGVWTGYGVGLVKAGGVPIWITTLSL